MKRISVVIAAIYYVCAPLATHAQVKSSDKADTCAYVNLAHRFVRCAAINNQMAALLKSTDGKQSAISVAALGETDKLMRNYLRVALIFYEQTGNQLTRDVVREINKQGDAEIEAALSEFLDNVDARLRGKKSHDNPNGHLLECSMSGTGAALSDTTKLALLFNDEVLKAKEVLTTNTNCVRW